MNTPPNILLIVADDHRASAIAAHGDPVVQTPVLDRLVARGTSFRQNYQMGGLTGAVCIPTRAALLTGVNTFRAPVSRQVDDAAGLQTLDTRLPLLPEVFARAGYRTFATGKWHNDKASFSRCFDDGANLFFGGMSEHNAVPIHAYDGEGAYPDEARTVGREFSTDLFANAAIRFLNEQDGEQPFFLYLAFTAPHDPRTPPAAYADLYAPETIPLPPNFLPEHPFDNGELWVRDEQLAAFPRTQAEIRRHIADYYGMISHLDVGIGRVLEALQANGFGDNTIIVYTADHGLALGQHGLMGKQNLYDHSVRVPLILSGPALPWGQEVRQLSYTFDLYPTLCELAELSVPETVEARSLLPLLADGTNWEYVCSVYKDVQRMITDGRWKLIQTYRQEARGVGTDHIQLFDLQNDPGEMQNLSMEPVLRERILIMQQALADWQHRVDDPLLGTMP